jgi:hypothetical protein
MTVNNDHADDQPLRPIRRLQIYRRRIHDSFFDMRHRAGTDGRTDQALLFHAASNRTDMRLFLCLFAALLRSRCLLNSLPRDFCAFYQSSRSVDHLVHLYQRSAAI